MIRWKVVQQNNTSAFSPPKYSIKYKKGNIVEAKKGTLGIFVFKRKQYAKEYVEKYNNRGLKIIKVECFNKGKIPKYIASGASLVCYNKVYEDFYLKNTNNKNSLIPKGTICYPKVLVLE